MNIAVKLEQTLHPLTSSQREIWFDQLLHAEIPLYNIGGYVDLPGPIDPVRFEYAVNLLVQKHDTLRTILTQERDDDGVPLQTYAEQLCVAVPLRDVSAEADPHAVALAWMQARFVEPFELYGQPLFRYDLVKLGETRYYWLLQYHHLIIDGWGVALLNRSLAAIYSQLTAGHTPDLKSPSYLAYIEDDRAYVDSARYEQQRAYWLEQYPHPPEPLLSPRYRSTLSDPLIGSGCQELYLSRAFYQRLHDLARAHNADPVPRVVGSTLCVLHPHGPTGGFCHRPAGAEPRPCQFQANRRIVYRGQSDPV